MVSDNGLGIPEQYCAEIFNRFYRGKEQQVAGSGLGLSIVRAVAERYGGSIALVPSSHGACFELRLPIHCDD
jgi:signal transduction histidine kinase